MNPPHPCLCLSVLEAAASFRITHPLDKHRRGIAGAPVHGILRAAFQPLNSLSPFNVSPRPIHADTHDHANHQSNVKRFTGAVIAFRTLLQSLPPIVASSLLCPGPSAAGPAANFGASPQPSGTPQYSHEHGPNPKQSLGGSHGGEPPPIGQPLDLLD